MESTNQLSRLNTLRIMVLDKARKRAERIKRDATNVAREIEVGAGNQARIIEEIDVAHIRDEISTSTRDLKRRLAKEYDGAVLARKHELLDRLLDEVKQATCAWLRAEQSWYLSTALPAIITSTIERFPCEAYELVVTADARTRLTATKSFPGTFARPVSLSTETLPGDNAGCIIRDTARTITVDNTVSAMLAARGDALKARLASMLFTGDAP